MNHIAIIKNKPQRSGKASIPDGAVNGNGDLGIILGNCEDGLRIYLSKCDIWQGIEMYNDGGLRPLGYIDLPIPENLYNNYYVEQDMDRGEIRCRFGTEKDFCTVSVRVCKAENSVMLELSDNIKSTPILKVFEGETAGEKGEFSNENVNVIFRIFAGGEHKYETSAFAAMKKINDNKFYTFVATNHDVKNPKEFAIEKAEKIDENSYEKLKENHYKMWEDFYKKSSMILSDKTLENLWYSSQYFLACTAGNKKFPPGIYANFVTVETPMWHSDYHLNYNYQAPFYAVCSSNHPELTDCYSAPLEEFMERGKAFAKEFGCRGILYPVGLAPKAMLTEYMPQLKYWFLRLFLGQRSNAIHPADIMVFRWNATRDKEYAKNHAYPYIKACLEFFEDYATFENGRFSICQDAVHEVPYYKADFDPKKYKKVINDKNNALTLGLLRMCIPAAIDMAKELGVDADKRRIWADFLEKLSPFATYIRFGKRVYRYTEKGQAWNDTNDVGLQHMYPCGCVGLSSPKKELEIARNTFKQKEIHCYNDDNAFCSFYPMSARLGMNPHKTLRKFKKLNSQKLMDNLLYDFGGGCLENCSTAASTLNEMAMQSYDGIIRIFPCWDKKIDAEFKTLRADGAFLVSSSITKGEIGKTEIYSEIGGMVKIANPHKMSRITCKEGTFETSAKTIVLNTNKGEKITIEKS